MVSDAGFGAWLAVLACISVDLGLNIARFAHVSNHDENSTPSSPPPMRQLFVIGAVMIAIGAITAFTVFAFVPMAVLIAIFAIRFVTSLVFSWAVIGILPTRPECIGAGVYIIGLAILMQFCSTLSPVLDSTQIMQLYTSFPYLIIAAIILTSLLISEFLLIFVESYQQSVLLDVVSAVAIGAHIPIFAKQLATLAAFTYQHRSYTSLLNLYPALLLFITLGSYWLWLRRMRACINHVDIAMRVVPMHTSWTAIAMITGVAHFQEYQIWNAITTIAFIVGSVAVIVGVGLMANGMFSEKDLDESKRKRSWKEMNRKDSGMGVEILRLGQNPAFSLPVRSSNVVGVVFAPSAAAPPSLLTPRMIADCRQHARLSTSRIVYEKDPWTSS
jgi:hypothetical protein